MNYHYFYSSLSLLWMILWLLMYLYRKDLRKEMLTISLFFGIGGILVEFSYLKDYWQPMTITNTAIGIEDFIAGFAIGGIATVLYEEIFHKRLRKIKEVYKTRHIFFLFLILYFGGVYLLKLPSFYTSIFSCIICTAIMLFERKDLIRDSLVSGFILMLISVAIYLLLKPIYPHFFSKFWLLSNHWYDREIFGILIREAIWFFFVGAFIAPLYPFWQREKLK